MGKPRVYIDTNVINNPTPTGGLLGSSKKLKSLEAQVDIVIPEIVRDELIEHKRQAHEEAKQQLLNNALLEQIADRELVEKIDFCAPCALSEEIVNFATEDIKDFEGFYRWMRDLALRNKAPFDKKTDKGVKDAIIAFVIDEYIREKDSECPVILVSNDSRLGEYFQNRKDVVWVKSLKELEEYLETMQKQGDRSSRNQQSVIHDSKNVTAKCHGLAVNNAPTPQLKRARELLTELRNSGNFATTHKIIADLQPYLQYLADEDYVDILLSALNNSQIMWLAQDTDVESFLKPIFDKYKGRLSIEQYNDFVNRTGWPNYRVKEPVEAITIDDIPF